ncbi:MAG: hypothetical protein MR778_07855 [Clostridiales bacterium]|nr:hypothetical protein [Clostridiales bacterium]MDD6937275.1 hypothetical protein [Clostridiales bacterium]MDY2961788.1 hypothetical protein [Oscillospiraceae bacterium]
MKLKRTISMLLVILIFASFSAAFALEPTAEPTQAVHEHVHESDVIPMASPDPAAPANVLCDVLGHTKGTFIRDGWVSSPKYDFNVYCYYNMKYEEYFCGRCNTRWTSYPGIEDYCTHLKVYDYLPSGALRGWHCSKCPYISWK